MDKKDLSTLFIATLFRIPDYQRGYAWEDKQIREFIEDVDALVEEHKGTGPLSPNSVSHLLDMQHTVDANQ